MNQKVRTKREQLNNIDSSYTMYGENKKHFGVLATMRKQEVICNGQYQSLHDREELRGCAREGSGFCKGARR